ncbi:DUF397 domain-containing protein [Streptomyces pactum]|uniref:DUF397 domain-containing protein n=1 Tax=Streptomyces pactum TaxID=68249 RepID=A0ABS0NJ08_9ACTN|nr:DUF397 domain-containing protein [Streptomyces pactum]MBH5335074.1 DUF397 domain-containing protein [Streptomyces pactum]
MTTDARTLMAHDLIDADWIKSSYSGNGNNCVEVADLTGAVPAGVGVRDSKDPDGPALVVSADGWSAFVSAVRRGEFPAS